MNKWFRVILELRHWLRIHWRDRSLSDRRRRLILPSPFLFCFSSQTDRARCFSRSQLRTNEARTHCGDLLTSIDSSSTYFFRYLIHSTATYFVHFKSWINNRNLLNCYFPFFLQVLYQICYWQETFSSGDSRILINYISGHGGVVCIGTSTGGCNSGKVRKKKLTVPPKGAPDVYRQSRAPTLSCHK